MSEDHFAKMPDAKHMARELVKDSVIEKAAAMLLAQCLAYAIAETEAKSKARIEELEAKVKNLTAHHPNMIDPRYWEGRYRDEKASVQELEAEVKAITAHSVKLADELATARSHYADESDAHDETSAKLERAVYVIGGFQTAIKTGRNEPLMIWSDQANILLANLKGGDV